MILRRSNKLQNSLTRTRQSFFGRIAAILGQCDITEDTWEELEALLIQADVGASTTIELVAALREQVARDRIHSVDEMQALLKHQLVSLLQTGQHSISLPKMQWHPKLSAKPLQVLQQPHKGSRTH